MPRGGRERRRAGVTAPARGRGGGARSPVRTIGVECRGEAQPLGLIGRRRSACARARPLARRPLEFLEAIAESTVRSAKRSQWLLAVDHSARESMKDAASCEN